MANLSFLYMIFINLCLNVRSPSFMQVIKIDAITDCVSLFYCLYIFFDLADDYQQQLNFI